MATRATILAVLLLLLVACGGEGDALDSQRPDGADAVIAGRDPDRLVPYPSPDGAQRAEVAIWPCHQVAPDNLMAYEELRLIDGESVRITDQQLINCGGAGAFGLEGRFWSPGGRYFYYTNAREGFPGGCGFWEPPLLRVDAGSGAIEIFGGGPLSPDGRLVAYWDLLDLVVRDLDADEVARLPAVAPDQPLGPIVWSPDGTALAYLQAPAVCGGGGAIVGHVDLETTTATALLNQPDPPLIEIAWPTPDSLLLTAEGGRRLTLPPSGGPLAPAP